MMQPGVYGEALGKVLRSDIAPVLVNRSLRKSEIAITEVRSDMPETGLSGSMPADDAYMISLKLKDYPDCEGWAERKVKKFDVFAGATYIYDLKTDPRYVINKAYHSIFFYVPLSALNAVAEQSNAMRIHHLYCPLGEAFDDPVIRHLGMSLLDAVRRPDQANQLFVDHVTMAIALHAATAYGGLQPIGNLAKGGLTQRQLKRVCDYIDANLDGATTLQTLATECGLSSSHFARAFRHSTGMSPHQWLLRRRVETAKALMQVHTLTLAEVAVTSGFTDASHLSRVFKAVTGVNPGAWRRTLPI
ncbi:MAG: AraC family transcriptional regulator [Ferrovibrio sp.]|uniref:helix-turn-helix domain-containing protein n=1 Tax=Ferrovibrio sp. TaxID=1917215 RepID=UPI0026309D1E|nr:AraC family transcriptional regulator [Ferrovibrio sp.]MCW0236283.1 AraC family transcriptional regulator [Ferrovibrio sp.]